MRKGKALFFAVVSTLGLLLAIVVNAGNSFGGAAEKTEVAIVGPDGWVVVKPVLWARNIASTARRGISIGSGLPSWKCRIPFPNRLRPAMGVFYKNRRVV